MIETNEWKRKVIKFLTAQTISLFGSSVVQYAIIWYITLTTSSGMMMTIATLCGYVPQIGVSLFAGVWVDRYDRKKLIMIADGCIACATLSIGIIFLTGYKEVWLLFLVLIIRSIGTGIQTPAVNAIIPQLVPKEHLMKVNGINSSLSSLTIFLSPAVSGAVLSVASIEMTFLIDVVTAILGIGIMFTIAVPKYKVDKIEGSTAMKEMKLGFAYLKSHKHIQHRILFLIVVMILISPSAFLTPLMVSRTFGGEVWKLTLSQMVFSLGAVAGGTLIASWGGFKNRMHTILAATLVYGIMMIAMGSSPFFILYLLANFTIGISMPCFNAPVNVLLQEEVEANMHGRVFSIMQIANVCALPFGTLLFGPLADRMSVQSILIGAGIAVVVVALIASRNKVLTRTKTC